jgi:ABC-type branched-subunit amino acid transport system ATPase component
MRPNTPPSAVTSTELLALSSVRFSYGDLPVLFDVDFTAHEDEMFALLGTNGAGKSTILRLIAGLERPASGGVSFAGEDITRLSAAARLELGIVLIVGGHAVFPDLSVEENLTIGGYSLRASRVKRKEYMSRAWDAFPALRQHRTKPAAQLSGGLQQQVALARAIALRPRLLCVDELSLGLAPAVTAELASQLRALNEEGTTVVLVEQSLNVASNLCDRAVFLERGAVRFVGPPAELLHRPDLARAVFLGAQEVEAS